MRSWLSSKYRLILNYISKTVFKNLNFFFALLVEYRLMLNYIPKTVFKNLNFFVALLVEYRVMLNYISKTVFKNLNFFSESAPAQVVADSTVLCTYIHLYILTPPFLYSYICTYVHMYIYTYQPLLF